jgi:L-rhamnose mutarotase
VSERVCFTPSVRPDRLEEYRARHREVWAEMLDALRRSGWRNSSLFPGEDGLLVGYLECEDFAAAKRAIEDEEVTTPGHADWGEVRACPEGWSESYRDRISATPTAPGGSSTTRSGRPSGSP